MPTEAELEQEAARQRVDDQAERVAAMVLALSLGSAGGGSGGGSPILTWPAELEKAVASLAKLVGLAAVVSLVTGVVLDDRQIDGIAELQDEVAPLVRKVVEQDIVGAARQRQIIVQTSREPAPTQETVKHWSEMIGRTAATRASAEVAIEMAEAIQELLETKLVKLWISRGDSRVRPLHRTLHGRTEKMGEPFWRELATGRELRYPGDPRAPIGQVANCRCALFLARAVDAKEAERVFHLDDSDFALAASVHPADLSPSGYRDLHAARLVRELTAAATPGHTGVVIVLIPDDLDEIEYKDGDRAPAHSTLAYLGDLEDATELELAEVRKTVERLADIGGPFEASVAGLATLGDKQDEVVLVEAQEIQDLHDVLLSDETCRCMLEERNEHPHFIPHVSYPHAKAPEKIRFSKIGCWIGDDRVEYDL